MSSLLPAGRSLELSQELLQGAIDIHVHAGPHIFSSPRRVDPIQAAIEARAAGMRAIVYMDVFEMSNGISWLVNRHVPEFTTYGGLIINTVYGGMNPRAVKTALNYGDGARFVSFGAHSTHFQAEREGHMVDGKFVSLSQLFPKFKNEELGRCTRIPLDSDPGPELDEILSQIGEHKHVFMNTGHVSVEEALRLVELAPRYGIGKILVASAVTKISSIEQMKQMIGGGAFIEHTLAAFTHTTPIPKTHYYVEKEYISIDEGMPGGTKVGVHTAANQIRELGAKHFILASDFGVYTLPTPVEGLREFIACMLDLGISPDDVRTMVKRNPAILLGLDA